MSKKGQNMFPKLDYVPQKRSTGMPASQYDSEYSETVTDTGIDVHTDVDRDVDSDFDTGDTDIFGSDTCETVDDKTFPWANYFAGMSNRRNRPCTQIFVPRRFCIYM